ncbi:hypothetical protein CEXT_143771 [Caerostris extrusa]|uniref:Uncharacterized protein n=1 Tax=Caerostris extrusa TaxID=172846 RepID=A0AAV4X2D1_CAEEX|nr:hypothetical protein CEXT_143771 [Caerostris extrusa]
MDATLKGNVAVLEQLRCFERLQNAVEGLILLPLTPSLSASGTKVECRFLQECWHKQAVSNSFPFNLQRSQVARIVDSTPSLSASGTKVECRFLQECWNKQARRKHKILFIANMSRHVKVSKDVGGNVDVE